MPPFQVPAIKQKYSDTFSRDAVNASKKIRSLYGTIIKDACTTVGINENILIGFMIVENTAIDPGATSYGCSAKSAQDRLCAYGLTQMQVATAFQTLKDQAPKLKSAEVSIIQRYLPGFLKPAGFVGFLANWKEQIYKALMIPEFSIWVTAMHLGQLIIKNLHDFGSVKLDHLIVKYNRGIGNYNKEVIKAGLKNADTATLVRSLPVEETRNYIIKFLGQDGAIIAAMKSA